MKESYCYGVTVCLIYCASTILSNNVVVQWGAGTANTMAAWRRVRTTAKVFVVLEEAGKGRRVISSGGAFKIGLGERDDE